MLTALDKDKMQLATRNTDVVSAVCILNLPIVLRSTEVKVILTAQSNIMGLLDVEKKVTWPPQKGKNLFLCPFCI